MSHLTQSQFNAARIRAEEIIKNIRDRIENLNVRDEVMEKILKDLDILQLEKELANTNFSFDYTALDRLNNISKRANSFMSSIDTYIAYNFDLEITDYKVAISQMTDLIFGSTDDIVSIALSTTDDDLLKSYIVATSKENNYKDSNTLLEAAKIKMQDSKLYQKRALQNAKKILKNSNFEIQVSDNVNFGDIIENANKEQNEALIENAVRNRVLTSVIKIIKNQGFIVKKENVEECGDHAKIFSVKPNGEEVNFVIYLDGKFIYKFHNYEGLSCEKDIENFEKMFESIYGIELEDKKILWSNPDRNGKMANQTINILKKGG